MIREVSIGIQGMTCASCVQRVEKALNKTDGVHEASVNLATEKASIRFDDAVVQLPQLVEAVKGSGYEPLVVREEIMVSGMTCASCVQRVEKALNKLPAVLEANVNLATEKATVVYLPASLSPGQIDQTIRNAGYTPIRSEKNPEDAERAAHMAEYRGFLRDIVIAVVLTIPVLILALGPQIFPVMSTWIPGRISSWIQLILATPVQFVAGYRFYKGGWAEIKHRSLGMNTLVMTGTSAAYFYSVLAFFFASIFPAGTAQTYFDASTLIVTLILLGKYLESLTKGRTSEAIKKLVQLQAKTARVLRDGQIVELPIETVIPGDLVMVRPGERLPVDGVITEGSSFIDQSAVTGESVPEEKQLGDEVISGTVNGTGSFTFKATRVGAETVLSQIIKMVEEAQSAKPAIQRMADQIAAIFAPVVLSLSAITFLVWLLLGPAPALSFAFVAAVSVLVIACPCAMGLATPTAIMVGSGRAAEMGVLFRKGTALEGLDRARTVILDKTGTVTLGSPELTNIVTLGVSEEEVLPLVAAAESRSEHPIATAIVRAAKQRGLDIPEATEFEAVPGYGLDAKVSGRLVQVGAERFMHKLGISTEQVKEEADRLSSEGKTPLYVAFDNQLTAVCAVADPVKEGSIKAIRALASLGMGVMMVTGDNLRTAQAIARRVGIEEVTAEVLPQQKAEVVKKLQAEGRRVVFVGDGINDAPALAQADVGMAIGTGTDIAIEAADVVLMSGDLRGVVNAVWLARKTVHTIKMNFVWAYGYNLALIPVAAGALYPAFGLLLNPAFAAAAMGVSSIFVLTNSLRLKRFRPVFAEGKAAPTPPVARATAS